MTEKRDYSLCIDCRHQRGTWVSDREVDTWCTLGKTSDCDETFECRYFEGYDERFTVPVKYRFSHSKIQLNGEPLTNDELVRILNTNDGAFVENFALKQEIEQLKHDLALYEENNTNEVLNQLRIELTSRLNDCIEEFKQ